MDFAFVYSRCFLHLDSHRITVEVRLSEGPFKFSLIGLAANEVKESVNRITSAIESSGFTVPKCSLTINLSPADLPKKGSHLDLPIAIAILIASQQIRPQNQHYEFVAELSLSGALRSNAHSALFALHATSEVVMAPSAVPMKVPNAIFEATDLKVVCNFLEKPKILFAKKIAPNSPPALTANQLSEIKGQHLAKRALWIASSGFHHILMMGAPGSGKSLLAHQLPSMLPPLNENQSLELCSVQLISNNPPNPTRPFRSPHHSVTQAGLIGGGLKPMPGEISLAHHGVLFLDEVGEYAPGLIDKLREPLQNKCIHLSRSEHQCTYPSSFLLVMAMNPCPCGYYLDNTRKCSCELIDISKHQRRLSGPILDRIDLHVQLHSLKYEELFSRTIEKETIIDTKTLHEMQYERQGVLNGEMNPKQTKEYCTLSSKGQKCLEKSYSHYRLSARSVHQILRISRTIADIANEKVIQTPHVLEALAYKSQLS